MQNLLQSAGAAIAAETDSAGAAGRLLAKVTIVVPLGPGESSWRGLLPSFSSLAAEAEVVLVATEPAPVDFAGLVAELDLRCQIAWAATDVGRARQMNVGANLATREFLWFLHADSRLTVEAIAALDAALGDDAGGIFYFDLQFDAEGSGFTRWNTWGVYLRSHLLRLPFGDQGFSLRRANFHDLGGFDEHVDYGEDHLLVWAAHRQRVPLKCVGAMITTSARKYAANGWLRTTSLHLWRTWRQASPQWLKLVWSRLR